MAPLALSASLCGFGWGSACLRPLGFVSFVPVRPTPGSTVLRVSALCRMVLRWTSGPIIESCLIIACSVYHSGSGCPFVDPWASADPTYGCRALTLFLRPQLACTLLRWPQLVLLLLRVHPLALGFLLWLRSLVRCKSLRWPQPVALRSLTVRRFDLPTFLIVFYPGFCLSTPGCMFGLRLPIAVRRLYRLFCPVRGDTVRSPMPHCLGVRVYVHGEGCGLLLGVTVLDLYVYFGSLFYACPSLKCPVGLCFMDT